MNCFFVGLNTWTDKLPLGFFSVDQRTSARRAGSRATLLRLSWVAVALSTRLNFFTKSCALMSGSQLQRTTLGKKVLNRENWISHWRIKLKMEFKKDKDWRDSCRWVNFMLYSDSSPKRQSLTSLAYCQKSRKEIDDEEKLWYHFGNRKLVQSKSNFFLKYFGCLFVRTCYSGTPWPTIMKLYMLNLHFIGRFIRKLFREIENKIRKITIRWRPIFVGQGGDGEVVWVLVRFVSFS